MRIWQIPWKIVIPLNNGFFFIKTQKFVYSDWVRVYVLLFLLYFIWFCYKVGLVIRKIMPTYCEVWIWITWRVSEWMNVYSVFVLSAIGRKIIWQRSTINVSIFIHWIYYTFIQKSHYRTFRFDQWSQIIFMYQFFSFEKKNWKRICAIFN